MAITTESFVGAPADVLTKKYTITDIPIEFFVSIPQAMFDDQALFRSYPYFNYDRLLAPSDFAAMEDVVAPAGYSLVIPTTFPNLILDATAELVGNHYINSGGSGDLTVYGPTAGTYAAAPLTTEFVYPHITKVSADIVQSR